MTGFKFGTFAEYIAVNQNSNVLEMPKNATYEEAAAIIFGGQTAIRFLEKAHITEKTSPKILIIGATVINMTKSNLNTIFINYHNSVVNNLR